MNVHVEKYAELAELSKWLLESYWAAANGYLPTKRFSEGIRLLACHKCGTELPEGTNYCFKCGSRVSKTPAEQFEVNSEDLVKKVKELLHEGNVTKIIVHDEQGKLLLELPVTAGLIGALLAPWLAAVGAIAALVTRCTISVERKE